ncbi:hypothetical protein [Pseudomonas fluorescens]|uniref:hypothetical protein n=1 Tax=Pseudomonas fluorescens TaxID=294 RepID=UPI001C830612|nr:hypothetical protein [Pseudomonas fluorescens]
MMVCVFLAAERQTLLPNVFLLPHRVVGLVDDGFVNHRVSGLSAAGAFGWYRWLIHGSAPVVFPMHPSPGASVKIPFLHHAHRRIHISGRRRTFRVRCWYGWLAWFRVLTSGEHGQFQSWRGIGYLLLALTG